MAAIAAEWPRLLATIDDLAELYDDVPIVDFVPLFQSVMRLSFLGVVFDDAFLARLDELHAGIVGTDEDTDADGADQWIDAEDLDEDGSERWIDYCEAHDDFGTGEGLTSEIDRIAALGCPDAMAYVAERDAIGYTTSEGIMDALLAEKFRLEHRRPPTTGRETAIRLEPLLLMQAGDVRRMEIIRSI